MSDGPAPKDSTSRQTTSSASAGFPGGPAGTALAGGVVGFILGFVVATATRSAPDAPAPAASVAAVSAVSASAAPQTPPVKGGPPEVALDFGTDAADRTLRGTWSRAQRRQHSVAETAGPDGTIEIPLTPVAQSYGLGVLASVVGIGADDAIEVNIQLNKRQVARWRLGTEWDMQGLVLPAGSLLAGANVLEFSMPSTGADPRPVLALDSLHLGPLLPSADANLGSVNARGSLIRGYHGKEGEGAQAVTWSAGLRTRVGFLVAPASGDYDLALDGYAFGPLQPLDVEAVVNARSIGTAKVDKGPRSVFHVPAGVLTQGLNIVEFVYPKSVKPSDTVKGSQDQRDLAIRISAVSIAPAAPPAAPTASVAGSTP